MANLDAIRDALDRLKLRLAAGEIDEVDYDRLKLKVLEGLSESELARLDTTPQQDTVMVRLAAGYELAGRYQVEERIGAGGLGVIYRVTDTRLKIGGTSDHVHIVARFTPAIPVSQMLKEHQIHAT
jgi:hypothetical protein